jgi:uncharacterized membrane protein YgcG
MKHFMITVFLLGLCSGVFAQKYKIKGAINDINDSTKLVGASVLLINQQDSTKRQGVVTDVNGVFEFTDITNGNYRLRVTFLGYAKLERRAVVRNANVDVGMISLISDTKNLKDVVVTAKMERVVQKGDTLQYNAAAFKTNPDANAEELIAKMPNITIENGKVKAQGEDVKKVTVDGREFFGNDAALALKNLPAEVIDKIQVFDRMSDQAQFTGFDDGNSEKSINIVTRTDRNNGQFGRFYAGAGTNGRYAVGINTNYFKKDTRVSILGQTNNINQQNFSMQDILGALGSGGGSMGGGQGGGGGRQGGGGQGGGGGRQAMGGGMGSGGFGGNADNFMVGQQSGISTTHAIGLNYSDNWGKKIKVTGSYFYNKAQNENNSISERTYFTSRTAGQIYNEDYESGNNNGNHRANMRLEYTLNTRNSVIVTPTISFQANNAVATMASVTKIADKLVNQNQNNNRTLSNGFNFSNNILWRHRFEKMGRTVSLGLTTSLNDRSSESYVKSQTKYFNTKDSLQTNDQRTLSETNGKTTSLSVSFTEPLNRTTQLQFSYNPSYNINYSDRQTSKLSPQSNEYSVPDVRLSNTFDNTYLTQRGGVGLRLRIKQTGNLTVDLNYQGATLGGHQLYPTDFAVNRTFHNFLPSFMFMTRNRTTGSSWRINYRTSTNAPSISQLQNVINNTNALILRTGNPDLRQEYSHSGSLRYGITKSATAQSFFVNLMGSVTRNNITTATLLASKDTTIQGFLLKRGSQLSRPINIEQANWNIRSFITFGVPVSELKANLNFNGGVGFSRVFGVLNNVMNTTNNTTYNGGLVLSSSQSERFDYTLSYSANYNVAQNTLQPSLSGNYFYQNTSLRLNWLTKKGFFLNTNTTHTLYTGLGQDFNQSFMLWNGSVGQKFWKRQAGELKMSVFDVLGQNNSVSRNITETYIEDAVTRVLQRYYMLTFTYTLRNFR